MLVTQQLKFYDSKSEKKWTQILVALVIPSILTNLEENYMMKNLKQKHLIVKPFQLKNTQGIGSNMINIFYFNSSMFDLFFHIRYRFEPLIKIL